jgi:DNA-binding NarL/FixJ family response regulator
METPPSGSTATRIVLADDHRMFREALRTTIDSQADMAVIGEAGHGLEAVALTRQLSPDVLLLDLAMPGMDGLEALRQIASSASTTRVILLTAGIDKTSMAIALRLGARGLILKESGSAQLLKGIRGVRDGQYWVGREAVADLVQVIRQTTLPKAPATRDFGLTLGRPKVRPLDSTSAALSRAITCNTSTLPMGFLVAPRLRQTLAECPRYSRCSEGRVESDETKTNWSNACLRPGGGRSVVSSAPPRQHCVGQPQGCQRQYIDVDVGGDPRAAPGR